MAWYIWEVSNSKVFYNAIVIAILPVLIALLIHARRKDQRLLPTRAPIEIALTCYVVGAAGVGLRL
jgi:glucan phosphoethanolaminetransferase (alkaline phosphatase superfamily)